MKTNNKKIIKVLFFFLLALFCLQLISNCLSSRQQSNAIISSEETTESIDAEQLKSSSSENELAKSWVNLELANLALKQTKPESRNSTNKIYIATLNQYQLVSKKSASYAYAQFYSLQIINKLKQEKYLPDEINQEIKKALNYFCEKSVNLPNVDVNCLDQLQAELNGKNFNKNFSDLINEIEVFKASTKATNLAPASLAMTLDNAKILLKNKKYENALKLIQEAKTLTEVNTNSYFEIVKVEERVLRENGKIDEANSLLSFVADDPKSLLKSYANLELAKFFWRKNKNHDAKIFLEKILSDPSVRESEEYFEAKFIEGRIFEEQGLFKKAEECYKVSIKTPSTESKIRFLRRLILIEVLMSQTRECSDFLQEYNLALKKFPGSFRNYLNNENFYKYWLSVCGTAEEKERHEQGLIDSSWPNFYQLILAKKLNIALDFNKSSQKISNNIKVLLPLEETQSYFKEAFEELEKIVGNELAQKYLVKEIDWRDPDITKIEKSKIAETIIYKIQIYKKLLSEYNLIKLIEYFLNSEASKDFSIDFIQYLFIQKNPVLFEDDFQACKKNEIPPSFAQGIARTESYFNPKARSPKNAKGLMQLIDSTAKKEGLESNEDLFTPSTNIYYGCKHLKTLFNRISKEKMEDGELKNKFLVIASYNAGFKSVQKWDSLYKSKIDSATGLDEFSKAILWAELIPFPETNDYVKKVALAEFFYLKN